jgi:hypothetical protein
VKERAKFRLDDIAAWAAAEFHSDSERHKHSAVLNPILCKTNQLRNLLLDLNTGPEGRTENMFEATCTDGAAWLEECLHRTNAPFKTAHEWYAALHHLQAALHRALPSSQPAGTFVQIRLDGKPIGRASKLSTGAEVDPRGRKERRPVLKKLVHHLLDVTHGKLTFDNNTGSGSLGDALVDLRPHLPDIIPRELPLTTVARMVREWRKASEALDQKTRPRRVK